MLEALCRSTIAGGLLEHEFDGCSSAQVFCTASAITMFFEPAGNIERDAGVQAAVRTAKNVQAVIHRRRQSGVSALESIAQNTKGPDLEAGQVVLCLGKRERQFARAV
jgi:hypothetical protein